MTTDVENQIENWLEALKGDNTVDMTRIIGEVLVGIYANTYEIALQLEGRND